MLLCVQFPVIAVQLKIFPLLFTVIGASLACYSNFYTIFMQGGVGKNGSTVAVSNVTRGIMSGVTVGRVKGQFLLDFSL